VEVLRRMTMQDHPGTFNVGGTGVLLLSQAIRRMGRPSFPVISPAVSLVAQGFRRAGLVDFSPEQMRYLEHGRVADVSALARELDVVPRPTSEAFDDFAAASTARRITTDTAVAAEQLVLDLLAKRRGGVRARAGAVHA
jgi:UDP-glucose 4-epimerase